MTMSRMTLLLILAGSPAAAQPVTAEQALDNYSRFMKPVAGPDCPRGGDPEEITVCGRASGADRYRLPAAPLEPGRRIAGETVSGVEAMKKEQCTTVGPIPEGCGFIPLLAIGAAVAKTAVKIIAREVLDPDE